MDKPKSDEVLTYVQLQKLETRKHADALLKSAVAGPYDVNYVGDAKQAINDHIKSMEVVNRGFYDYLLEHGSPSEIVMLANGLSD